MRYLTRIVVATVVLGMAPIVFAQDVTPTPAPFPRIVNRELRQTAQRIHQQMMEVNRNHLAGLERILERLRNMLERITAIADRREARGMDASGVYAAIAEARRAVDAAQHAVREQASREYLLEGTTDASARDQLQGMREQLADDLARVGAAVRTALQEVRAALQALRDVQ
jgi:hypothetical protein